MLIGHGVGQYLGLNEIGSPSSIIIFIIIFIYLIVLFKIYLLEFLGFICYDFYDLSVRIFFWCP